MSSPKRKRDVPVLFWVSADEMELIQQKMAQFGTKNLSAYLRKMAVDGYVVQLDLPELKELVSLLRRSSMPSLRCPSVWRRQRPSWRTYQQQAAAKEEAESHSFMKKNCEENARLVELDTLLNIDESDRRTQRPLLPKHTWTFWRCWTARRLRRARSTRQETKQHEEAR